MTQNAMTSKYLTRQEDRDFTRTIKDRDGNTYQPPEAEYNYDGDLQIEEVLEEAKSAAASTELEHEILVSQTIDRKWHGHGFRDALLVLKETIVALFFVHSHTLS